MKGRPPIGAGFRPWKTGFPSPERRSRFPIFVQAPQALARRLSHIGVVSKSLGQALQAQLRSASGWCRVKAMSGAGMDSLRQLTRPMQRQNGWLNATGFRFLKLKCAMLRRLRRKPPRNLKRRTQSVEAGARTERERREALRAATASLEVSRAGAGRARAADRRTPGANQRAGRRHPPHRRNRSMKCAAA